jgi:hypothetical protein
MVTFHVRQCAVALLAMELAAVDLMRIDRPRCSLNQHLPGERECGGGGNSALWRGGAHVEVNVP